MINRTKVFVGLFWILLGLLSSGAQQDLRKAIKEKGRYVPEIHGGNLGKYRPDYSGKYIHIPVPYDGGYGDRGLKYIQDPNGFFRNPDYDPSKDDGREDGLFLGPNDHLRFMIDFNYNGSGWQIIQFEWVRDGDEETRYNYKNENKLWSNDIELKGEAGTQDEGTDDKKFFYNYEPKLVLGDSLDSVAETTEQKPTESPSEQRDTSNANVHVDGEFNDNAYNLSYNKENIPSNYKSEKIQNAIREVLGFIERNILPNLH